MMGAMTMMNEPMIDAAYLQLLFTSWLPFLEIPWKQEKYRGDGVNEGPGLRVNPKP